MENITLLILDYLFDVVKATILQLLIMFGPMVIFGLLMHYISKYNWRLGSEIFGVSNFLYVFGWLGVSAHEIGHAIFAVLFGHKINEIKLFQVRPTGNELGYVSHSYTKGNIYHYIGNFFIGIGPILFGSILLYIITYFLFGAGLESVDNTEISHEAFRSYEGLSQFFGALIDSWGRYFDLVLFSPESTWWKVIIYLYLLYAIGSAISLSSADINGAMRGFRYIVLLFFVLNLALLWLGGFLTDMFEYISLMCSGFYFLTLTAMLLNLIFLAFHLLILVLIKALSR